MAKKEKLIKSLGEAFAARVPIVLVRGDNATAKDTIRTIEVVNVGREIFKKCVEAVEKIALGIKE